MTDLTAAGRPLPKRTLEYLAACEAVGLHYWADCPQAGHVWAVDDHQRAHIVRIRRGAPAQHVCQEALEGEPCTGREQMSDVYALKQPHPDGSEWIQEHDSLEDTSTVTVTHLA